MLTKTKNRNMNQLLQDMIYIQYIQYIKRYILQLLKDIQKQLSIILKMGQIMKLIEMEFIK